MNKLGSVPVGHSNPVRVMGILNTSPESFFKKSVKTSKQTISESIQIMEDQGADFIDVGGMSTAPYLSTQVSEKIETRRIINAIKIIQNKSNLPISVDTCRSSVAESALKFGIDIINDISGLKYDKKMKKIIEKFHPSLILCAFSKSTIYGNLVLKTKSLLKQSITIAKTAKIPSNKITLDPSIGFFRKLGNGPFFTKITTDWINRDLEILQNLKTIKQKYPLLVSVSNKSFIGKIINQENPNNRLAGSLCAEVTSVLKGADIIRTHNVRKTKEAIVVAQNILRTHKGL